MLREGDGDWQGSEAMKDNVFMCSLRKLVLLPVELQIKIVTY